MERPRSQELYSIRKLRRKWEFRETKAVNPGKEMITRCGDLEPQLCLENLLELRTLVRHWDGIEARQNDFTEGLSRRFHFLSKNHCFKMPVPSF